MILDVSTSPRATWVWAPDVDQAQRLRDILTAAGCSVQNATGRNAEHRVLDLDIGVVALEGLEVLIAAGYSFRWHNDQHPLNRSSTIFGLPVVDAMPE